MVMACLFLSDCVRFRRWRRLRRPTSGLEAAMTLDDGRHRGTVERFGLPESVGDGLDRSAVGGDGTDGLGMRLVEHLCHLGGDIRSCRQDADNSLGSWATEPQREFVNESERSTGGDGQKWSLWPGRCFPCRRTLHWPHREGRSRPRVRPLPAADRRGWSRPSRQCSVAQE